MKTEPGQEDESIDFIIRERGVGGDDAILNRLLTNPRTVDPRAIIGHLQHDAPGAVQGAKAHQPLRRLARSEALLRRFQPVVDGVADHMRQRVGDALDDGFVDFCPLAFRDETHLLAGLRRDLPHQARHALEHGAHGLGADRHHAVLNFPR